MSKDEMKDDMMDRLMLKQATALLLARTEKIEDEEEISLWDAAGRILAEDITATRDQPPFPRSPLDGYAVRSRDIENASGEHPVKLAVIEEVVAGHVAETGVTAGTAVRIMTGAPIPEGADCVVGQEDTDRGEDTVEVYVSLTAYQNYCFQGEDYGCGALLLSKDTRLGAVEIGVIASTGRERVRVYRRPAAAIITTGDETVLPGENLVPGKIYDANLYTLTARMSMWDIPVICRESAADEALLVADKIRAVADRADIIITTGGVSVGKKDIIHDVIEILGAERLFWGIAIKPGMPTLCARYRGKLLICLSGNPYGAAVNLELLVRPVLAKMSGRSDLALKRICAISESVYPKKSTVTRYVRAYYDGERVRIPSGSNDSGILSSMCGCNCLIELPSGTERLDIGDTVWIILL